jgi:DnaJ-class molecular chaperone
MKQIMKTCATCNGEGMVKRDTLGEIHTIDTPSVWCAEAQEFLTIKEEICPDCDGLGEIDITDDYYLNEADDYIKVQKEL